MRQIRNALFSSVLHGCRALADECDVPRVRLRSAGEGPENTVKHGRILIGGQTLIAMDSHVKHEFTFNEGVSLQVMCDSQRELDHYWEALSEGGVQGPCGWLKDRFGVSWQVVPRDIAEWMTSRDAAARDRAFQAVMGMKKLDIAMIRTAFEGSA